MCYIGIFYVLYRTSYVLYRTSYVLYRTPYMLYRTADQRNGPADLWTFCGPFVFGPPDRLISPPDLLFCPPYRFFWSAVLLAGPFVFGVLYAI